MAQKIFKEHVIIARIYQKFGDREILEKSTLQAEEHYTKSLNILGNLNQKSYLIASNCYFGLGKIALIKKDIPLALTYFQNCLNIRQLSYEPGHHDILQVQEAIINLNLQD